MWVKASGSDLATMTPEQFAVLRMDEMTPLIARDEMSDEDMVAHLARCMVDPALPRPSIETLLHAFIPAPHVHHTHPDAINTIAGCVDGEALARECFGDEVAWIEYIRPGFTLAKQVGEAVRDNPGLRLVILAKHGLVCWGDSAEQAYRTTIDVINRAAAFVNERTAGTARFGGSAPGAADALDAAQRDALLTQVLPVLRGALSSERPKILTVDTSPRVLEFVCSRDAAELVTVGAACPDHLVHTKRVPLWIAFDPATDDAATLAERIASQAAVYREEYRAYFERFAGHPTTGSPTPTRASS